MAIKFEQAEFLFLKDVAEEILSSDTYHPSLRRTLPGTDGTKIWHTFHRNGTKAAILCAMLVALEKGEDPITAVSSVPKAGPIAEPSKPDTFTDAALQQQGDAPKPDFNSLKKPLVIEPKAEVAEKTPSEQADMRAVAFQSTLNDDIGQQEEELIPPGKMQYTAPREPEPTPTEAPKNKGGRPKKIQPDAQLVDKIATAEDILDKNLRGKQP